VNTSQFEKIPAPLVIYRYRSDRISVHRQRDDTFRLSKPLEQADSCSFLFLRRDVINDMLGVATHSAQHSGVGIGHILPSRSVIVADAAAPANVTGSRIATLNDTCGNLIQVTQLMRW
jgi:urocanate hydratase